MSLSNISKHSISPSATGGGSIVRSLGSSLGRLVTAVDTMHSVANHGRMQQNLEQSLQLNEQHHKAVMDAVQQENLAGLEAANQTHANYLAELNASHKNLLEKNQSEHISSEAAANSEQSRRLELLQGIHESAKPGTKIDISHKDLKVSYTKAHPNPEEEEEPQETSAEGEPTVGRDPKTGQATSLKKKK
jgi:hypothetical protein